MPIMKVISTDHVPVKIWTDNAEPESLKQLVNTARLPFVFKHVAAMPDVHFGIGATVGSVVATKGAVCPAAVGVDIGCGMMAVKTTIPYHRVMDKLPQIRHSIERSIPLGMESHKPERAPNTFWSGWERMSPLVAPLWEKGRLQIGTLGGGNHFIELCLDTENSVWIMLHSGSRGIGNKVAKRHIDIAKGFMKTMFIELPDPDLAYFAQGQPEFRAYVEDVQWCQEYAMCNRETMMAAVIKDLTYAVGFFNKTMEVNCHHNYLEWENHYGENVLVTRKGAVRARKTDLGIIPGSMGAKSFIVRGLGNPESFDSCSHGAGRRMSRTKAREKFTIEDLAKQTSGVECRKDLGVLDEIPGAYKDIDEVMANQSDLVEVVAQLKQVLCVKG